MKKTLLTYASTFFIAGNCLLPMVSEAQITLIHEFYDDDLTGINPEGSLTAVGSYLYGMTPSGGPDGAGDIFKIKPDGTGYATVMSFDGITGANPAGDLLAIGDYLYGTSRSNMGKVFKVKTDGTGFTNIHSFDSSVDGFSPRGSLIYDGTFLYGTTSSCGVNDCGSSFGTLFKIMPDGTGFALIHDFDETDGSAPLGALLSVGSYLYGTTSSGGTSLDCGNGCGTIFKIKNDGSEFSTLLSFSDINGTSPLGSLITDGTALYGTTDLGGTYDNGVIFKINLDGTGYTKLRDLNLLDGENPKGDLISAGGFLYGTTFHGGTSYFGTIFKIKSDGSNFSVVDNFNDGNDCDGPMGSLISDGTYLYGLTTYGGSDLNGTVFKYQFCTSGCNVTPTAIAEHTTDAAISITPNPSTGVFHLQMNTLASAQVKVFNVLGECVYKNAATSSIDLSAEPDGVYFMSIQTNEGTTTRKVVIGQ